MGSVAGWVLTETAAWLLVVTGTAALVLPGPGLLMMFAGLSMLARHYAWAERWLDPVRRRALQGVAHSVATWPRIALAAALAFGLIGCGVLWTWSPPAAPWWPVSQVWWLPGGVAVAVTQVTSGVRAGPDHLLLPPFPGPAGRGCPCLVPACRCRGRDSPAAPPPAAASPLSTSVRRS